MEHITEIDRCHISLPVRDKFAHKGSFGKVLLICGSEKYTGAAFFSAQAAVNTGSGLVFLSVPKKIRPTLAAKLNEPILTDRKAPDFKPDATLLGCGIGLSRKSSALVKREIYAPSNPLILDADAITLCAKDRLSLKNSARTLILTPHEGEFSRLVPEFDSSRREEFAANFARENRCVLVLKGHRTITAAPDGRLFANTTGNPGMAKGGSGDVLAGIITSLVGQGIPPTEASYTGVWLHGAAGDAASEMYGEYSMTPTDMLCTLKSVIGQVCCK
ncbi:MAG: NAD(P)H-hydrate dehydratase [Oscillospiraceae bacterium]|nr:NAD(P)H-hydrate dehydratase [Oscillospiraceae bacterium]